MQWQVKSKVCSLFYLLSLLSYFGPIPSCGILWRRPNSFDAARFSQTRSSNQSVPCGALVGGPDKNRNLVPAVVRRLLSLVRVVLSGIRVGLLLLPSCHFPNCQSPFGVGSQV